MRRVIRLLALASALFLCSRPLAAQAPASAATATASPDAQMLKRLFDEALARGQAYENLRALVTRHPGRLSGTKNLADAIGWAENTLNGLGLDRVYKQDVMVPHWDRGARESVVMITSSGDVAPLAALALGGSPGSGAGGVMAEVVEVKSLDEVVTLGASRIEGKVVFFNRPMDLTVVLGSEAYRLAVDQRSRGPATAARYGAVGTIVRSMTHALDDLPHTGGTSFPSDGKKIPAAAISTVAAEKRCSVSSALSASIPGTRSVACFSPTRKTASAARPPTRLP